MRDGCRMTESVRRTLLGRSHARHTMVSFKSEVEEKLSTASSKGLGPMILFTS